MIDFIGITLVLAFLISFIGLFLGATFKFTFFPGVLIGISEETSDYEFENTKTKERGVIKITQIQVCLICFAMTVLWESK